MNNIQWRLLDEIIPAARPGPEGGVLPQSLAKLTALGVGPETVERVQSALAVYLNTDQEPPVRIFVPENTPATGPPLESWRFFIVAQGGQQPSRLELYAYL